MKELSNTRGAKKIYLIFTCDSRQSRDSMRLVGVFLNITDFRSAVKRLILNDCVEVDNKQETIKELSGWTFEEINDNIKYVYVYESFNGEFSVGSYLV